MSKTVNQAAREPADPAQGSGPCEPDLLTILWIYSNPALVADYETQLPDKHLLQAKLDEVYALASQDAQEAALEAEAREP